MSTRPLWPTAAAAILLAVAGLAQAQALDPSASVSASQSAVKVGEDGGKSLTFAVRNAGALDATATVAVTPPAGWSVAIGPGDLRFALPAGSSRTITVLASPAPDAPREGPAEGPLVLSATMTDGAGRTSPPASAATTLAFLPPPDAAVEDATPAIPLGAASLLLLALLAALVIAYLRRASQVDLLVDPVQRPITTGTDGIFLVLVENRSKAHREVEVQVRGLPDTWHGAFSFPKVQLGPGERGPVPLCIKVPPNADDGHQVDVLLRARPAGRYPWLVSRRTRIEAHDRVRVGGPPASRPRP